MAKSRNKKHGASQRSDPLNGEYGIWRTMKTRCFNPNHRAYPWYGGKGITVCDRWKDSFENFMQDMGPRPTPGHSIERKNTSLGYSPENCVWIPSTEQMKNSAQCVYVKLTDGRSVSIREAARLFGVLDKYNTFYRLVTKNGFTPEQAGTRILKRDQSKLAYKAPGGSWHASRHQTFSS
jgi:hypothetical protein